jgi:hypothetical protein
VRAQHHGFKLRGAAGGGGGVRRDGGPVEADLRAEHGAGGGGEEQAQRRREGASRARRHSSGGRRRSRHFWKMPKGTKMLPKNIKKKALQKATTRILKRTVLQVVRYSTPFNN